MDIVSLVIVNYNGEKYNEECINSILKSKYTNKKINVIVVDNASTDNSVELIKEKFSDVIVIENENNTGFAGATNLGIKYAEKLLSDYIILLNNDTVIDELMINIIVDKSKEKRSVVSPKIMYHSPSNKIWSAGGDINWKNGITIHNHMDETDIGQANKEAKINFSTGCCMCIPIEVIKSVGYLDEYYFLYYEDTDYSVRIIEAGFEMFYVPEAIVYHKISSSTGGEYSKTYIYYLFRNRLYFNKKFNINKNRVYISITIDILKKCIKFIAKFKFELIYILFKSVKDYINEIKGKVEI